MFFTCIPLSQATTLIISCVYGYAIDSHLLKSTSLFSFLMGHRLKQLGYEQIVSAYADTDL
jgi:hypothetical protein